MIARVNQLVVADHLFAIGGTAHILATATGSEGWSWRHYGGLERYGNTAVNTDYLVAWERPLNGDYASSKFYLNGVEQARTTGASDSSFPTDTKSKYFIGKGETGNLFNGRIGELIVLNNDSNTERHKVEGYLAHKWGLVGSLSGSHAYRFAPPVSIPRSTRQSFTTPTNVTPPVLGSLAVANLEKTTADIEGTLLITEMPPQP